MDEGMNGTVTHQTIDAKYIKESKNISLKTETEITVHYNSVKSEIMRKDLSNSLPGELNHHSEVNGVVVSNGKSADNLSNSENCVENDEAKLVRNTQPEEKEISFSRKNLNEIIKSSFTDSFVPPHQMGPDYLRPAEKYWTINPDEPVRLRIVDGNNLSSRNPQSLITTLQRIVQVNANEPAMSVKNGDGWITYSYQKYWDDIHLAAKGFIKLGLKRYQSVCMLGFNRPELFITNFAAIFAGGFTSGIYTTNSPAACEFILQHSRCNIIVLENEKQLAKIMQVKHRLPHLKAIIQYSEKPSNEDVFSWHDLMKIGESVPDEILQRRIKSLAINECCSLVYTSGTTGDPKAVMLTHDNFVHMMMSADETLDFDTWPSPKTVVSFLPINHLAAQVTDIYSVIAMAGHVYFAQPDALKGSLRNTLCEIGPLLVSGVPRIFEKIHEKVEEGIMHLNPLKAAFVRWALRTSFKYNNSEINGGPSNKPFGYKYAERVVSKIRKQVGLHNAQHCFVGGAPFLPETDMFFISIGIILQECYGMSESTGPHIVNLMENYRKFSAGRSMLANELKIDDPVEDGTGEICMRGRGVFMGYMYDEERTLEILDPEGWLHSGDIGRMDKDGFVFVTGRIKELIITAGGENVAPSPIEQNVKSELPLISQAIVIGDKKKFISLLLTIKTTINLDTFTPTDDLSQVSIQWCRSVGSNAKTVQDILRGPDKKVMAAIQAGIDKANEKAISNVCVIRKWKILPKDFSLDGGELSNTMKIKRHLIAQKYKDVIDSIYNET